MSVKLLLIEDEEKLARVLELELGYEGYEVTKAFDGRTGLALAEAGSHDLVLLDIMLPELNGMEVLRRLRKTSSVPVILLTARDNVIDKVSGLDSGADDYITKPFAIEELLARIRRALRNQGNPDTVESSDCAFRVGPLALDLAKRQVTVNGSQVELTKREFDLLHLLMKNKDLVISRDTLLEHVWDMDFDGGTNAVDVYIRFLRTKIDEAFGIKLIHTVRGVGYVVKDEQGNK